MGGVKDSFSMVSKCACVCEQIVWVVVRKAFVVAIFQLDGSISSSRVLLPLVGREGRFVVKPYAMNGRYVIVLLRSIRSRTIWLLFLAIIYGCIFQP